MNVTSYTYMSEIVVTIGLFFLACFFYLFISFYGSKQNLSQEKLHRLKVNTRNIISFVFIVLTVFIWFGELKTSIISAAAICSAVIITFKEVILSFFGTLFSNQNFKIGDYIDVDYTKGKIINRNFLNTTILINDTYQSQELIVPNIIFLTNKVKKLSKLSKLQFFSFNIMCENLKTVDASVKKMYELAVPIVEKNNPNYSQYFKEVDEATPYFDIPDNLVSIDYHLGDAKSIYFTVNFLAHPTDGAKIEREITQMYLESIK